ncbi:MAG: cellulase family glycosylhydrolase [Oscillospiraceae bacterium]|nr:cellulase family glycosylhydrolase [Oscillospiraceae bacterium]
MKLKRLLAGMMAVVVGASCTFAASAGYISNNQPLAGQESWTTADDTYCELISDRLTAANALNVYSVEVDIVVTALTDGYNGATGEIYFSDNWSESAKCYFGHAGYGNVGVDGYISCETAGIGLNTIQFEKLDGSAFFASEIGGGSFVKITAWDDSEFSVDDIRYYDADGNLLNVEEGVVAATDSVNLVMNVDDTYTVDTSAVSASDKIVGITMHVSGISANDGSWYWGNGAVQFTTGGNTETFTHYVEWSGVNQNDASIFVQFPEEVIESRLYSDLIQICYYSGSGDGYFTLKSVDIHVRAGNAVIGDADANGLRDENDILYVSRHVLGILALSQSVIDLADINTDATINVVDELAIARDVTGIDDFDAIEYDGSANEFVANMGFGWNLGNSLDSYFEGSGIAGETGWSNPIVTQALIQAVKGYGFSTIRVPVTWMEHMESDGTIQTTWMQRVNTVVDYAIDEGMYVILNTHWDCSDGDESWISDYATDSSVLSKYQYVWEQIGEHFIEYDEHLIFEGMNEVGFNNVSTTQGYTLLNNLNCKFVDTVRAQGGWNAERLLLISGYWTDINETCSMLQYVTLPDDDFIAMSVHYYTPAAFCINGTQTTWYASDTTTLQTQFAKMNTNFVEKGIPVIVGEYGFGKGVQASSACTMVDAVLTEAEKYGMCAIIWDQGEGNPVIERTSGSYSMTVSGLSTVFANHAN